MSPCRPPNWADEKSADLKSNGSHSKPVFPDDFRTDESLRFFGTAARQVQCACGCPKRTCRCGGLTSPCEQAHSELTGPAVGFTVFRAGDETGFGRCRI